MTHRDDRPLRWAILAVLVFGGLQVAELVLDRLLLPFAGTLATAALLAVAACCFSGW